jgi:hypothetical protein
MKIFGKRTKKKATASPQPTISDGDRAVLELLKKDPSELNAKQRRMIKRYEERQAVDEGLSQETDRIVEADDEKSSCVAEQELEQKTDIPAKEDAIDAKVDPDDGPRDGADDGEDSAVAQDKKEENENPRSSHQDVPVVSEEDVRNLLESLNSKNKRKLSRQLDREGKDALEEVYKEALRLLQDSIPVEEKLKLRESAESTVPEPTPSVKKRKRPKVDWSSLSSEERLRREEQQRLQKEAAERRAREGDNLKHRHPLNSERRRANRRKPKWNADTKPSRKGGFSEHDTSGYKMRRVKQKVY